MGIVLPKLTRTTPFHTLFHLLIYEIFVHHGTGLGTKKRAVNKITLYHPGVFKELIQSKGF